MSALPVTELRRARPAAGLLASMLVLTLASAFVPALTPWPAAACAWSAAALLWPRLPQRQHRQALGMAGIGVAGMLAGVLSGVPADLRLAATGNQTLIGLLCAVSFLRLVTMPDAQTRSEALPRGRTALWRTLLGVHLFGAVINIPAVFILADRLLRNGRLGRRAALVLTRGFCACTFWSPFFAAMAAALNFAPGARLGIIILTGLPLAALALWLTALDTDDGRRDTRGAGFVGYPMHLRTLAVPGTLVGLVLGTHLLWPQTGITTIVTLYAPLLCLVVLLGRRGRAGLHAFAGHALRRLGDGAPELVLFLAAGLLAAGITGLLAATGGQLPFVRFGPIEASLTLLLIVAAAFAGVHPVIAITTFGTWLAPLAPDPTLLTSTLTMGWAIGVPAGPLSGLHLSMQGRYGIPVFAFQRWNSRYIPKLLAASILALHLQAALRGL